MKIPMTLYIWLSLMTFRARSSQLRFQATRAPEETLAGAYVINLDSKKEAYTAFQARMGSILPFAGVSSVQRHPGVLATVDGFPPQWARSLLPDMYNGAGRRGTLGCTLAHMSLWKKVGDSAECRGPGGADRFALIFEDDERPNTNFRHGVEATLRILGSHPDGWRPDYVNLNALRPLGGTTWEVIPHAAWLATIPKEWNRYLGQVGGKSQNVWASLYLVRCGSIGKLLHEFASGYDGLHPLNDWRISDLLFSRNSSLVGGVIIPMNAFSLHEHEMSSRLELDGTTTDWGDIHK